MNKARLQKLAGILQELGKSDMRDLSPEDHDRYARKLSSKARLGAEYPFKNGKDYSWEDFDREVYNQNPDPHRGSDLAGDSIYVRIFEDASSVYGSETANDDLLTWDEVIDEYVESLKETYESVEEFAKVWTHYEWQGPFEDLKEFVHHITQEQYESVVGIQKGGVAYFLQGDSYGFAVLDTTVDDYGSYD